MSKSTSDKLHNSTDMIRSVAKELERLSDSFYAVGNNKISHQLHDASMLLIASVAIPKMCGSAKGSSSTMHR